MKNLPGGYSAKVRQTLVVGDHELDVAECLLNTCYLRDTIDHPPAAAVLVIRIDDHERRKHVFLDHGLSRSCHEVEYSIPANA